MGPIMGCLLLLTLRYGARTWQTSGETLTF